MLRYSIILLLIGALGGLSCSKTPEGPADLGTRPVAEALYQRFEKPPVGLFSQPLVPPDNPMSVDKVELGYLLYFDKRLSADGTIACATCHIPSKGWADQAPVSTGIKGQKGTRSAPPVQNSAYMFLQFWDGRAKTLEEQALGPFINPVEMGLKDHDALVKIVEGIPGYAPFFKQAFGEEGINKDKIVMAIAAFERTIISANSKYDRYAQGDKSALNAAEIRGKDLFFGKAKCSRCHAGPNFSDSQFHNLGVGITAKEPDLGRYSEVKEERFKGAFKTPGLRDITQTAPYMHDGSEATLEAVMEFYNKGGNKNPQLDPLMVPLNLNEQEIADVIAYMKALDSDGSLQVAEPQKFPK